MGEANTLNGRVALVTGASSGLGYAAATALGARGARLAISSRGGDKLETAESRLREAGCEVTSVAADVSNPSDLVALTAEVESRLGGIDVLVANGGGPRAKAAHQLDDADWESAIPLALLFVPRLCNLVLPSMRERGWGRIVAINSISTKQPIAGLALSNALRPAVVGYLKTLSQEVAADGVTVNAVLPGYTRTARQVELAQARSEQTGEELEAVLAAPVQAVPSKRLAEPEEIGAVIGFLCSPEASYVTGQAVAVDGGYALGLL